MEKIFFKQFIELITFDQSLYKTEKEKKQLTQQLKEFSEQLELIEKPLQEQKDRVRHLRKDVDVKELEMKELDQQEKSASKKLDSVSNDKEYQALKQEISQLKKKQHDYEETLMQVWSSFEAAQKELEKQEKEFTEQKENLEQDVTMKQERLVRLQTTLDAAEQERKSKEKNVPEEWLEKYGRMRNAVANPVVAIESKSCSACFYSVSDQDLLSAADEKLLQCKGCYRFLYEKNIPGSEAEIDPCA
jgi:predicted  nucleic acid-binding Zn-ribbon protein